MIPQTDNNSWKGYTFEELQYQKILNAVRIESEKQRLTSDIETLKDNNPLTPAHGLRKIFNALSFVDYFVMGMKIFRRVRPLFASSRNKK